MKLYIHSIKSMMTYTMSEEYNMGTTMCMYVRVLQELQQ